ncbi:MAG: T9SS type A sorting domain-containing protein [Saprospiraceae bacterium]|nr:T9SS type A sorting domain-containing protein [Saprospiraceae bacterium]
MRKLLLILCALTLSTCWVSAQAVIVRSLETPQASRVAVPVQLYNIMNTDGIQLGLQWEATDLELDSIGFSPDYPMTSGNFSYPTSDELVFDWLIDYWETVRDGDTLFVMYFNVLAECDQASIELSTDHIPFRVLRGGQDVPDLQFVAGKVEIGAYRNISSDTTICAGDSFELFIDAPLATSFNWSGTDGLLSCTDCPRPTISELYGEASFSVEIEGPIGCLDTTYIFVNARSYLDFGLLPFSNSPVCLGDTLHFDPNVFGAQSYNWQGPNNFQSTEVRPRLRADSIEMSGEYELQLVDQYGCEAGAVFDVIVADSIESVEVNFEYGGCEGGSATMEIGAIEGGQAPFTFQLNGGEALPIPDGPFQVPFGGQIRLQINSASGCIWRRDFFRPEVLSLDIQQLQAPPCEGPEFDGALTAQVQGGVVPYAFTWSTAATSQTITGLEAAVYQVTVTDANGCFATSSYTLVPSPVDSILATPRVIVAGESSQLKVFGKNLTNVTWTPAATLDNPNSIEAVASNLLETTTFTVAVEDQTGCSDEVSVTVIVQNPELAWNLVDSLLVGQQGVWCDPTQNPLGLQVIIDPDCNEFQGGIIEGEVGEAANCLEYTAIGPGTDTLCFTTCLNTTDLCGPGSLQVAVAPQEDPVWPGDTNDDGTADQYDVLNFGFLLDSLQGPRRPNASANWIEQPAFDWSRQTPEQDNYKHIDTDGSGEINMADTMALHLNWGLLHDGFVPGTPIDERSGIPFSIQLDTLQAGQSYSLPVVLGNIDFPADDVYGLAFQLTYDPSLVVPGSVRFSTEGSWLGQEGQNLLLMQKEFADAGRLAIGMTRLDGNNVSGSGIIGQLNITIEDDILIRQRNEWEKSGVDFYLEIEGVKLISNRQEVVPVEVVSTEVEVISDIRNTSTALPVTLYPNPAQKSLWITGLGRQDTWVQFFDNQGRLVQSSELLVGDSVLHVQSLQPGLYWVRLWNEEGMVVRKVMIER